MSQLIKSIAGLGGMLSATACLHTVSVEDVFQPQLANHAHVTVVIDGETIFDRNAPTDGLWDRWGVTLTRGSLDTPIGPLAYSAVRHEDLNAPLIVYCGGAAFDTPNHAAYVHWLLAPFGDMVAWDYPGFGETGGVLSYDRLEIATSAMAEHIHDLKRYRNQPVILWGHSIGGFVCADLAGRATDVDAIVLEATGNGAIQTVRSRIPFIARPFVRVASELQGINNAEALREVEAPILVLAGARDDVIRPQISKTLHDELVAMGKTAELIVLEKIGHYDIAYHPEVADLLAAFFTKAGMKSPIVNRAPMDDATFTLDIVTN